MARKKEAAAPAAESNNKRVDSMNNLARRIWDGQSVSLPSAERKRRITEALIAQGYQEKLNELSLPNG